MSETETSQNAEKPETSKPEPEPVNELSKEYYRKKVWDHLESNKLVTFPRPAYGRIPNFKGCDEAAAKLIQLDDFTAARAIEVNPDKPLEHSRILVLQNNKDLYVPLPRLATSLLKKLSAPEEGSKTTIKQTVSRWGIENTGQPVDIKDAVHIDLLVVGSVAVSKDGRRIGKGKGYADLEYAILCEMGAVDDTTVIVTTVHDCQVFDSLPQEIFEKYDVPVDYILTPTCSIKVETKLPRPSGIFWNILSQRRVNLMPVLQRLKEKLTSEGKDTTLKEVDTDVETDPKRFNNKFKRFTRRRPRSASKTSEGETAENTKPKGRPFFRRRRFFRRSRSAKKEEEAKGNALSNANGNSNQDSVENLENIPPKKANRARKPFKHFHIDFSLMVSNIEKSVRIRDLKNALNERGIKPYDITWRGYKGVCYLHYAKPNAKNAEEKQPFAVDNVIEILQTLKISPECKSSLSVKVVEPITRIETTDVTAV